MTAAATQANRREGRGEGSGGRTSTLGPVFLSAAVFPGVGQLVQRRWIAGAIHVVLFGVAFGWFVGRTLQVLKTYYEFITRFNETSGEAPSPRAVAVPFAVCMVLYVVNVIDTALAGRRQRCPDRRPPPIGQV